MRPKHREGPRIGYLLKVFPRLSQSFVLHELLAHQRAGRAVEIFSLRRPKDRLSHRALGELQFPVVYPDPEQPSATEAVVRWCKDRALDHLHAHFGNVAAATAREAALAAGCSYSFTAHARDIFHRTVDRERLGERLRDAAFVATVSEFNLRYLQETYGGAAARVERIYNGLPLRDIPFSPASADGDESPILLAVGRWIEKKGFEVLIEACAILRDRGVRFRCRIAGSGEQGERYRERIDAFALADRVELIGPLQDDGVYREMRRAALFVAPCVVADNGDRDGLPTVLLEAMALGTPSVSTPVTGIPEAVVDGRTGRLVPEGDAEELAATCATLLQDPSLRRSLACAARSHLERHFDIDTNAAVLARRFAESVAPV